MQIILSDPTHPLESALDVKAVGLGVAPVDVAKEALEFGDFVVTDVVPHFEGREVGPQVSLLPEVRR
jgi:hypothetical protein